MTPPQRPKDLRVEKTIAAIHATFKAMLLAQPFATITVTALCERARINKKTFYRYDPTIDYLLRELQEEYTSSYLQRIAGLRFPRTPRSLRESSLPTASSRTNSTRRSPAPARTTRSARR